MPAFRRLTRRKQGDDPLDAIDQLNVGDEIAQLFERIALQQPVALDHGENVELARWKLPRHLLILPELGSIRAEQLTERIIDLEPRDAKPRGDRESQRDNRNEPGKAQGNKAETLETER